MSWISYEPQHPFPIQNLPYGVFLNADGQRHIATRVGDSVIDLHVLAAGHLFDSIPGVADALQKPFLNEFMDLGASAWRATRETLTRILSADEATLRDDEHLRGVAVLPAHDARMVLPVNVGDYTDFYASEEHATNLGKMFRPNAAPLLPNWKHIPIGYHGRASSIVVSGTNLVRPCGQTKPKEEEPPVWGPSTRVDFEIEMGAYIGGPENALGDRVTMEQAMDRIFGLTLFNDWSARDIQKWEYVPLGPFLGKSFGSTVSPWIITTEALKPFMVAPPAQDPTPLPYLQHEANAKTAFDVNISCEVTPAGGRPTVVSRTNMKYLYWTIFQQLTHHASNGCNMRAGDLIATGTISGPTEDSYGSMLELCWMGTKPVPVDGGERKFIADGDAVTLRAEAANGEFTIGFGEATSVILPAKQ